MFELKHADQIKKIADNQIVDIVFLRTKKLENAYRDSSLVDDAEVFITGETINIKIDLSFTPKDEDQNIPGVLEYGGVIFDTDNKPHEIESGYYIRRFIADGVS